MRIADLNTPLSQLRNAHEELRRSWAIVRQEWNDGNSQEMEENHLQPLNGKLLLAFQAIDQLKSVLDQAGRECGPWDSQTDFLA